MICRKFGNHGTNVRISHRNPPSTWCAFHYDPTTPKGRSQRINWVVVRVGWGVRASDPGREARRGHRDAFDRSGPGGPLYDDRKAAVSHLTPPAQVARERIVRHPGRSVLIGFSGRGGSYQSTPVDSIC